MEKKKVFIIHGHDSVARYELKDFLINLSLDPIILADQDSKGFTIIEKFENYAEQCSFAFALLTPDDKSADNLVDSEKWRARQNVILELGWFMRKLGRGGVALLHKGNVELPSDLLGIVYMPFNTSIFEAGEKIRQRLKGANLI